ncbi:hypothetical protein WG66_001958 [Moniliophthora roreri]|nr:hypothetical protein WG66_001958 [Moniliophthora roreri]
MAARSGCSEHAKHTSFDSAARTDNRIYRRERDTLLSGSDGWRSSMSDNFINRWLQLPPDANAWKRSETFLATCLFGHHRTSANYVDIRTKEGGGDLTTSDIHVARFDADVMVDGDVNTPGAHRAQGWPKEPITLWVLPGSSRLCSASNAAIPFEVSR